MKLFRLGGISSSLSLSPSFPLFSVSLSPFFHIFFPSFFFFSLESDFTIFSPSLMTKATNHERENYLIILKGLRLYFLFYLCVCLFLFVLFSPAILGYREIDILMTFSLSNKTYVIWQKRGGGEIIKGIPWGISY